MSEPSSRTESTARQVGYAMVGLFLLIVAVTTTPLLFVVMAVWFGIAFAVARAAERKGRSYAAWFWIALCFTIPAAIAVACMKQSASQLPNFGPTPALDFAGGPQGYGPAPQPPWAPAQYAVTPQPSTKTCPACAEQIQAAAVLCRYCGTRFDSGSSA